MDHKQCAELYYSLSGRVEGRGSLENSRIIEGDRGVAKFENP
jgi:hypothetical protein